MQRTFTVYIASVNDFRVEGLDMIQNVYRYPSEWKGLTKYFNCVSLAQCDFKIHFDPSVVEGDEILSELFRSRSSVRIDPDYSAEFPHQTHREYQNLIQPWLELMRSENSPFKWEIRGDGDSDCCMDAIAINDVRLAHAAIDWWQQTQQRFQTEQRLRSLREEVAQLERDLASISLPSVLPIEEEDYEYDYA